MPEINYSNYLPFKYSNVQVFLDISSSLMSLFTVSQVDDLTDGQRSQWGFLVSHISRGNVRPYGSRLIDNAYICLRINNTSAAGDLEPQNNWAHFVLYDFKKGLVLAVPPFIVGGNDHDSSGEFHIAQVKRAYNEMLANGIEFPTITSKQIRSMQDDDKNIGFIETQAAGASLREEISLSQELQSAVDSDQGRKFFDWASLIGKTYKDHCLDGGVDDALAAQVIGKMLDAYKQESKKAKKKSAGFICQDGQLSILTKCHSGGSDPSMEAVAYNISPDDFIGWMLRVSEASVSSGDENVSGLDVRKWSALLLRSFSMAPDVIFDFMLARDLFSVEKFTNLPKGSDSLVLAFHCINYLNKLGDNVASVNNLMFILLRDLQAKIVVNNLRLTASDALMLSDFLIDSLLSSAIGSVGINEGVDVSGLNVISVINALLPQMNLFEVRQVVMKLDESYVDVIKSLIDSCYNELLGDGFSVIFVWLDGKDLTREVLADIDSKLCEKTEGFNEFLAAVNCPESLTNRLPVFNDSIQNAKHMIEPTQAKVPNNNKVKGGKKKKKVAQPDVTLDDFERALDNLLDNSVTNKRNAWSKAERYASKLLAADRASQVSFVNKYIILNSVTSGPSLLILAAGSGRYSVVDKLLALIDRCQSEIADSGQQDATASESKGDEQGDAGAGQDDALAQVVSDTHKAFNLQVSEAVYAAVKSGEHQVVLLLLNRYNPDLSCLAKVVPILSRLICPHVTDRPVTSQLDLVVLHALIKYGASVVDAGAIGFSPIMASIVTCKQNILDVLLRHSPFVAHAPTSLGLPAHVALACRRGLSDEGGIALVLPQVEPLPPMRHRLLVQDLGRVVAVLSSDADGSEYYYYAMIEILNSRQAGLLSSDNVEWRRSQLLKLLRQGIDRGCFTAPQLTNLLILSIQKVHVSLSIALIDAGAKDNHRSECLMLAFESFSVTVFFMLLVQLSEGGPVNDDQAQRIFGGIEQHKKLLQPAWPYLQFVLFCTMGPGADLPDSFHQKDYYSSILQEGKGLYPGGIMGDEGARKLTKSLARHIVSKNSLIALTEAFRVMSLSCEWVGNFWSNWQQGYAACEQKIVLIEEAEESLPDKAIELFRACIGKNKQDFRRLCFEDDATVTVDNLIQWRFDGGVKNILFFLAPWDRELLEEVMAVIPDDTLVDMLMEVDSMSCTPANYAVFLKGNVSSLDAIYKKLKSIGGSDLCGKMLSMADHSGISLGSFLVRQHYASKVGGPVTPLQNCDEFNAWTEENLIGNVFENERYQELCQNEFAARGITLFSRYTDKEVRQKASEGRFEATAQYFKELVGYYVDASSAGDEEVSSSGVVARTFRG